MKKRPLTDKNGNVRELSAEEISAMRPAAEILPAELLNILPKRKVGERGMQKAPTKVALTLRYSRDVVNYFKATGKGWQVRIDNALKEWIKKHPQTSSHSKS